MLFVDEFCGILVYIKFGADVTSQYVSTVGINTSTVQKYIREQDKQDQIEDSLSRKEYSDPFKGSK